MPPLKLYCLPYAGGSSAAFHEWRELVSDEIELCLVEYPGRGARIVDGLYATLADALDDVERQVQEQRNGARYALFGHSLGSLLAFELAHRLVSAGRPMPEVLLLSGLAAPEYLQATQELQRLPDSEFLDRFIAFGGIPDALARNRMLLRLYMPVLRNDHRLYEDYDYIHRSQRLDCPVHIFHGVSDPLTADKVDRWGRATSGRCDIHAFDGGHFFVNEFQEQIVARINQVAASLAPLTGPENPIR